MNLPPSESDDEEHERRVLARAIRRLPRRCRDVFVLQRFVGMPLEQIADHLGVEKRAAETRLAEALVRLTRAVDEAGGGGAPKRK